MHYTLLQQFKKQLDFINAWFDKATEHAKARNFDPNVLVGMRLAPDQFALARQVQSACDTLKFAASRLTGKEPPSNPDTEQTLDELRARVKTTIAYLDSFTEKDFDGSAARVVSNPRWEGKTMTGANYFVEHTIPNFYFHLAHTYAILRHNGVDVGKRDWLGSYTFRA
jgi:hypothetical protein